ncbi:hypothetical protein OE88DRAFT_1658801 [Heliocybe sulcata]|uniref:Uncharacterized protein n=1 Tax=Heliocybe sulcata TaxID=5364 RepID=A0A5C3N325_9AGAM|nr:hypothetical protein OE88DRAFT_1658801 [Heliocybe sulcata]
MPRAGKGKPAGNGSGAVDSTGSSIVPEPVGLKALDNADNKTQKAKGKSKDKKAAKKQRKARTTFLGLIRDILFSALLIYSLFVCSPNQPITPDSHPICRALSTTQHRLVEPYILTPLRPALEHPAIAPYVKKVEPYRQKVITTGEVVINQTRTQWIRYVIPQWNKRVVPQWNERVVPELQKLEAKVEPYRAQVEREYHRAVAPRVRLVQYNLERWYQTSQPYINLAAQKAQTGYQTAKPYAIPVLQQFQQLMLQLYALFQEQRRKFVDPHLVTMWEKVTELSSGQAQQVKTQVYSAVSGAKELKSSLTSEAASSASSASATVSSASVSAQSIVSSVVAPEATAAKVATPLASVPASVVEAEVPATISSATSAWSDASESATETLSSASSVISSQAKGVSSSVSSVSSIVSEHGKDASSSVSSASSVVSTHAQDASSSVSSFLNEATSTVESVVAEVTGPSSSSSVVPPQPTSAPGGEDLDLNEFIEILGDIDAEEVESAPEETESEDIFASPTPSETAEDKEKKRAAVAEKRKDIMARHAKWEQELEGLIKEKRKALRKALVAVRKTAVGELKESKEINGEVEALVAEAEKFLKGADGYLKTLKKEERSVQDKERLWGKVLDRVEKKFEERIEKLSSLVNEWHGTVQYRELQEVNDVAEAVKDFAESAQANIGMDYAWLDDVDYHDWVRYHDLVRASENFTEQAYMIQNGSHPSPPVNPVSAALNDLEAEIKDIVTGFQTRLRGLKRSGARAFGGESDGADADAPTTPQSPTEGASILPVPDAEKKGAAIADGVPPVPVIGRSKGEVLEALGRVEAQEQTQPDVPGVSDSQETTPEEVVEQLVQDVEASESPAVTMGHGEL